MSAEAVEGVDAPTEEQSYRALFALPSIRRIVFGMALGRLASSMVSVAVILFSLTLYQSPVLTGIVTFASIFPGTVASPLAGALLDRYGRTRMVILDYLLAAASLILIAVLAAYGALPPWALVLIVGISSVAHPLSNSGLRTLFPIIVPRHLWTRVNAVDSNTYVVSQLIGPPVAGAAGGAGAMVQPSGRASVLVSPVTGAPSGTNTFTLTRTASPGATVSRSASTSTSRPLAATSAASNSRSFCASRKSASARASGVAAARAAARTRVSRTSANPRAS
jgi:MFS family permease